MNIVSEEKIYITTSADFEGGSMEELPEEKDSPVLNDSRSRHQGGCTKALYPSSRKSSKFLREKTSKDIMDDKLLLHLDIHSVPDIAAEYSTSFREIGRSVSTTDQSESCFPLKRERILGKYEHPNRLDHRQQPLTSMLDQPLLPAAPPHLSSLIVSLLCRIYFRSGGAAAAAAAATASAGASGGDSNSDGDGDGDDDGDSDGDGDGDGGGGGSSSSSSSSGGAGVRDRYRSRSSELKPRLNSPGPANTTDLKLIRIKSRIKEHRVALEVMAFIDPLRILKRESWWRNEHERRWRKHSGGVNPSSNRLRKDTP
ncbi:hypothetical protein V1477_019931 [Vespula maculifrons]|uniref:Uncharacterized protein n=1 Tax=Vespula maculifrons TaxID=7453 RepID=A0ABD2AKI1_VESMC